MPKPIMFMDRSVLAKVPWAWCSEATILMHCGVLGNQAGTENVKGALERLKASGHVIHRPHGVIMWRRNKET